MSYTKSRAIEFFYEFDQATNPGFGGVTPETFQLYTQVYGQNFAMDALVDAARDSMFDDSLGSYISGREAAFIQLADFQLDFINRHFPDRSELREAFEDFGHGVLHDNKKISGTTRYRRPAGFMNHMMDGSPDSCVGYHRWHAFIRGAILSGVDSAEWLNINRCVALAWAIYSELNPVADSPQNPKLDANRVRRLRDFYMNADHTTLDAAFLSYSGKFPADYGSRRARGLDEVGYGRVRLILSRATSGGNPMHGGAGRFWELPLSDFLRTPIYNHLPVAHPGANRGARSPIVKALKGELEGFGRMPPFPRPPVASQDISYIESWIDNLSIG